MNCTDCRRLGEAFLYAFDLLEMDGDDLRPWPLSKRKAKLARLLARAGEGLVLNEHIEADGAAVFQHACRMGLEGIVSKRLGSKIVGLVRISDDHALIFKLAYSPVAQHLQESSA